MPTQTTLFLVISVVVIGQDVPCLAAPVDVSTPSSIVFDSTSAGADTGEVTPGAGTTDCDSTDGKTTFAAFFCLTCL